MRIEALDTTPNSFCGFRFGSKLDDATSHDGVLIKQVKLAQPFRMFSGAALVADPSDHRLFKIEMIATGFSQHATTDHVIREYNTTRDVLTGFYNVKPQKVPVKDESSTACCLFEIDDLNFAIMLMRIRDNMFLLAVHGDKQKSKDVWTINSL